MHAMGRANLLIILENVLGERMCSLCDEERFQSEPFRAFTARKIPSHRSKPKNRSVVAAAQSFVICYGRK